MEKTCPFCGGIPNIYAIDDDCFIKTVVAICQDCGARVETKVNWYPFSRTNDTDGFEKAVQAAGLAVWNRRS